jgi:hypothetical protein
VELVEKLSRFIRDAERKRCPGVSIPRTHQRFAHTLPIAFGRNERISAPGTLDLDAAERHADGERWIVTNYGRAFAGDPDTRLTCGIVGIAAVLPVPPETAGFGRVRTVRATVQRFDAATVLGPEAVDLGQTDLF